jgi:hypothetical protein
MRLFFQGFLAHSPKLTDSSRLNWFDSNAPLLTWEDKNALLMKQKQKGKDNF